jgi:hypothetical protein
MDILVIASLILLLGVLAAWMLPRLACPWREQVALRKLAEQLGFRYYGRRRLGIPRSGRATGRLRDRACTIETFKQMGVDPYTRVIISVDNPHGCRFEIVQRPSSGSVGDGEQAARRQIAHSAPEDLANAVLEMCDLARRAPQFPRQVRANGYRLSLSGHALHLEHHSRWMCFGPVEQDVAGLHVLLETLCEAAGAIEGVAATERGRTRYRPVGIR